MPPARPKSVYLPVRRAPGSKFGCMSSRSAAFRIDSGQLRFPMMRNLTVILRDLNLGAWRPRQMDKTSLSRGRVVTFVLSQTDTDVIIRICFTYHIFQSSEQLKDFLFFFGGKSSSCLATFDNIVINRLSSNARHTRSPQEPKYTRFLLTNKLREEEKYILGQL